MKRIFIAVKLPEEVKREIERIQNLVDTENKKFSVSQTSNKPASLGVGNTQKVREKENLFSGKFTELENLHLTLKFLGEIEDEKIEEITRRLEKVNIKKLWQYFII